MDKKRFQLNKDSEWWFVQDNTIQVNEYGYRDDLTGEDKYRGLKQDLTEQETVDLLNEQQSIINKNKELLKLIAKACTYSKEHSVKEILRKEIRGIDTVTGESANAWHDYVLLSEFFKECYGEHWDNFD